MSTELSLVCDHSITLRPVSRTDDVAFFQLVQQMNPKLSFDSFVERLEQMLALGNYYTVGAYSHDGVLLGVSGYWIATRFYCGKYMDIDNFIVDQHTRSSGLGAQLITWLKEEAKRQKCETIVLDSYVSNAASHKFYFRHGFEILGFHFFARVAA